MSKDFETEFMPEFWEIFRKTEIAATWVNGLTWKKLIEPTDNVVYNKHCEKIANEARELAKNILKLADR